MNNLPSKTVKKSMKALPIKNKIKLYSFQKDQDATQKHKHQ